MQVCATCPDRWHTGRDGVAHRCAWPTRAAARYQRAGGLRLIVMTRSTTVT